MDFVHLVPMPSPAPDSGSSDAAGVEVQGVVSW